MDAKEIKSTLKAAREAIRQKDFKEALRNCKAVLKADKDNYNALVFIGVAAEGLEQPDQAIKAFEKATEISPEQILAWQGLCSFYEKSTTQEHSQALVPVYEKLVTLYQGEEAKWIETINKLAELHSKLGALDRASSCYHKALKAITDPEKQKPIWRKLANMLGSSQSLTPDLENMLLEAYKVMLTSDESQEQEQFIQPYLELLRKSDDYAELESESNRLSSCYPSCAYPLEAVLQLQLDSQIGLKQRSAEKVGAVCERLRTMGNQSSVLKLGEGFLNMINKDYTRAQAFLTKGVKSCPSVISGYVYLAEVLNCLCDYKGVISTCEQAIGKLKSKEKRLSCPNSLVEDHLNLLTIKSYICQRTELTLKKAATLLEEMTNKNPENQEILLLLADVYLKQGEITKVEEFLNTHQSMLTHAGNVNALKGRVAFARKDFHTAIQHLEQAVKEDGSRSEFFFQLGCVNWSVYETADPSDQSFAEKSFKQWLQAAKLNPNNAEVFRCLGDYYATVQKDLLKAKRCYQKSFNLNPGDEKTGAALCDSLTSTGEEEAARSILLRVTSQASAGSGKWAWLRLGLHQVKKTDHTAAMTSFQAALRADPADNHVWECLAEAYLTRGSYTAALKAFTKALELDPSSVYCLYQISFIKQTLGQFTEAVSEYKAVLETSPHYVPAMKGLGETLILLARSHLKQSFNLRAKDNCSEAIDYLTQGAAIRPDLSCLWKLLGDACTVLQPLSDKGFSVSVPLKLIELGDKSSEKKRSLSKEELLKLGARCYGQALKLLPDCAALWHDLGVNYFYQSQLLSGAAAVDVATKSLHILQKAVMLDPLDFRHWTALGRVACYPGVNNPSLAQHCFIKSILAERNNVVAWTNLGTLYLKNDNVKLAHDAFTVAQSLDPTYVACWIGQAMIAETVGHEDAMDLFRHTTELGHHLESALGYGHWVCTVMRDLEKRDSEMYKYCVEQMAAIPMASDALSRYLDRMKTNPTAYNMYGLLLEKQGLLQSAAEAFTRAISILETGSGSDGLITKECWKVGRGYGTVPISGQDLTFEGTCELALVHYKLGQLAQSFQAYERALELASKDEDKSHVYAAMGMVAYKFGDADGVKTALFNCSQTTPSSNHGLAALCSFGFLQSDETLVRAALDELISRDTLDLLPQTLLLEMSLQQSPLLTQALTDHPDNPAVRDLQSLVFATPRTREMSPGSCVC
ncbi:tetratricopeptide repeat protein 37-like [Liolophura sinensis]|uniref:tetratricopeptide repeat protein 37-like n=1 Tax=Liolophura sinensis TaxID=3198878 RepID=UPI0031591CD8